MGLSDAVARAAARRAHVLLVEVPGHWRTRVAVERALLARGWSLALSPADADILAVCGEPGPQLAEAVELAWHQMPGPRVRIEVASYDEAGVRLDDAHRALLDTGRHREDARSRPGAAELLGDHGDMDHGDMDHGDMDHGDMDHGEMEMAPGGIPLAEGGEDRDGLEMDVLTVRLGPVLAYWPAGLVLRCSLQGDVVVDARAEVVDPSPDPAAPSTDDPAARRLDAVVSLLALAGWGHAAAQARGVRDALLDDAPDAGSRWQALERRVGRSRLLRRSLRGVRRLGPDDLVRLGLPDDFAGDTHDRLLGLLDPAAASSAGRREEVARHEDVAAERLAPVVVGLELAAARLVVASLDLPELWAPQHEGAHRG